MADKMINIRLCQKYDTEANWTSKNPVLLSGEMAVSSDKNGQYKVGNGTSKWSQLEYNKIPWSSITDRPSALKNPSALTVQFNGVANKTYDGSSAQVVNVTPAAIGALPVTGGTVSGNLSLSSTSPIFTINNTAGTDATIILDRSSNASWKILNSAGRLSFMNNWVNGGKGDYFSALSLDYQSGNAVFKGTVTAPAFTGNAATATTASKLGTVTVGSSAKPIYLNVGVPTAFSNTIGAVNKPVYMNAGSITACSATVGSATVPVYSNGGAITACTSLSLNTTGSAAKWTTARNFVIGNKIVSLDGSKNVSATLSEIGAAPTSHTHNYMDLTRSATRHSAGSLSIIDAAKIDVGRACRTAFLPASGITVEYTTDGSTWSDYGLSDAAKQGLCSMNRATSLQLGKGAAQKIGNGVRITLTPVDRYSSADQFYCWFSTNGAACVCSIEKSTIGDKNTFSPVLTDIPVSGWSGNNVLSLPGYTFGGGSTQNSNVYAYRITFKITAVSATYTTAPTVTDLRLYGVNAWSIANNMMLSDHIYSWDYAQNVQFPAAVNAAGGLKENGTALSSKYQPKGNYAASAHTHTKSQITDMPAALKNPSALTISLNGSSQGAYDGSAVKSVNITAASIGAAASGHSHSAATTTAAGLMSAADKKKLDKLGSLKTCTLTASGWSNTAPYTQTVNVTGITSADNPIISLDIPDGTTAANEEAMMKAYGYLSNAATGSGVITFKCISKRPEISINLTMIIL